MDAKTQEQTTAFNSRWYEVARKNGVRGARMGIARVTPANATALGGLRIRVWRNEIYEASLQDPVSMRADAARIRRAFERGREVRTPHPNGTDLTLALAQRPIQVTLGEVTPEEMKPASAGWPASPKGRSMFGRGGNGQRDGGR